MRAWNLLYSGGQANASGGMFDVRGPGEKHQGNGAVAFGSAIVRELRGAYAVYFVAASIFAGVALLPAQLLHFFTVRLNFVDSTTVEAFLMKMGIFGLAIAVCLAAAAFGKVFVKEWLLIKLEVHLRQRILDRLHALPLESLERAQRGDWLTRISGDVRVVEDFLGSTVPDLFYSVVSLVGTAALLIYYSGWIGVIPVAAALLIAFLNFRIQKILRPLLEGMRTLYSGLFQILLENLEGWKTVKSFGAAAYERKRVDEKLTTFSRQGRVAARLIGTALSSNDLITHVLLASCLMTLAWGVANGKLTPEAALFFPFYLSQFLFSVKALVMGTNSWSRYQTNGGRLSEFFQTEGEEFSAVLCGALPVGASDVSLTVTNLTLGDRVNRSIAGTLSLEIVQGKLYGLTGPSGCGKSTFLEVLAGLRSARAGAISLSSSTSGEILAIDSAKPFLLPTQLCAYVEQKPYVFEGTLRANLSLGCPDFSDDALNDCLGLAGLEGAFAGRGGLSMIVSDRGQNISVGQLYRIAIARALLLHRPFLLLDEPFAALDGESAAALVKTLERLKQKVGVFIVTHYLPPSLTFDRLFSFFEERPNSFFDFGSQSEPLGEPGNLIAANGPAFRKLTSLSNRSSGGDKHVQ